MKTINEIYAGATWAEVQSKLEIAGMFAEVFRRKQVSLGEFERKYIQTAREMAEKLGISRQMQIAIEAEGAIKAATK